MDDARAHYVLEETNFQRTESTRILRGYRKSDGKRIVLKIPRSEYPSATELALIRHERALLAGLDAAPVARALDLVRFEHGIGLVLEDAGTRSFDLLAAPDLELPRFLRLARLAAAALMEVHAAGILHKDIKPHHLFADAEESRVVLIDFGIATTVTHEEQRAESPDALEGTLSYISPEQTGRMNRAVDRRSDLYSLGVTFYELLTGVLPFETRDPLELVHCHIARSARSPSELRPDVSEVVSGIVMRLLEKVAESRYQTAAGLIADLARCEQEYARSGQIESFPLGEHDHESELRIPQKLYGREADRAALVAALARAEQGKRELVLLSGGSGIGKSALVHELYRELSFGGNFVFGKFDQFNRSVPYAALARATGELVRVELGSPAEQLEAWKQRVLLAVGQNGRLLLDVVPELALVIGPQPAVAPLGPSEAQNRFERLFQRFIQASANAGRPLVVFLDDLQWADAASLRLLSLVLSNPEQTHLLFIGSYRDNEVNALHPLRQCTAELAETLPIVALHLEPLCKDHIEALLADTFPRRAPALEPLAELLLQKTGGNPFFIGQFLEKVASDGLLGFDPERKLWSWQLEAIQAASVTANVVDLVLTRLQRQTLEVQVALEYAACIGYRFDSHQLGTISGLSPAALAHALWEAARDGFIIPLDKNYRLLSHQTEAAAREAALVYRFSHDRVQQAAYALIPEQERGPVHLRIGRLLLARTGSAGPDDELLFDVVNALNLGRAHIDAEPERRELAALNLRAATRAQGAGAPAAACQFAELALALLGAESWTSDASLSRAVLLVLAECRYLTGDTSAAVVAIAALKNHARDVLERVTALNLETLVLTQQGRLSEACETITQTIRLLGVSMPDATDKAALGEAVGAEFGAYQAALAGRSIESLADLPAMTEPESLALVFTCAGAIPAAFQSNSELFALVVLKAVQLPPKYGTAPVSSFLYELYGVLHATVTGDLEAAYRFGVLGIRLSELPEHQAARGAAHFIFAGFISAWRRPLSESLEHFRKGARAALDVGDPLHAAYCLSIGTAYRLYAGEPLESIQADVPGIHQALTLSKDVINLAFLAISQQTIRCLSGETAQFGRFDDAHFSEQRFEAEAPPTVLAMYGANKAMVRYFAGDAAGALRATETFTPLPALFYNAEYKLYHALALADLAHTARGEARAELIAKLEQDALVYSRWAALCPENFSYRFHLLEAELAALGGQLELSLTRYEEAINEAAAHGSTLHVALANELCGRFHQAAGRRKLARIYTSEARYHYERWGALGKVAWLDQKLPERELSAPARDAGHQTTRFGASTRKAATATNLGGDSGLDLMSAMRATQAIASELELERLVERLLRILVENAGAQRGLLILPEAAGLVVIAALGVDPDRVELGLHEPIAATRRLAASVVQYVARSKEPVVLDDASQAPRFARDEYLKTARPRSLLCMPLLHQGELAAILYLENSGATGAFTAARLERLTFLGSHAAVAIENAKLYGQVQAATRRLEEANDTLEHKVRERTAELRGRNEDMRRVLDNVTQGLIGIDLGGQMAPECSVAFERWFGAYRAGALFVDHVSRVDQSFADWFAMAFQTLVDGFLMEALALDQLPARLRQGASEYRVSYCPVRSGERLTGLLIVIDDVTDAVRRAREEAVQKEQLAVCQRLAQDRSGLLGFFDEGLQMVADLQAPGADAARVGRLLHTLKGNAGMMGLSLLAERCHQAEDALAGGADAAEALPDVFERWQDLLRTRDMLLGQHGHNKLEVALADLEALLEALRAGAPAEQIADELTRWRLEPLLRPLSRLGEHAQSVAERLGKAEAELSVTDGGVLADPQRGRALWSVLVHIIRNAVDHGFETAEERAARHKPAKNQLALRARLEGSELLLEIADDGRGIDWERVRERAAARGLPAATRDDLFAALFAPELSTRSEVTSTSGRGIGLSAVQRDVHALGGTISAASETGHGCAWTLRLPAAALGALPGQPDSSRRARRSAPPPERARGVS